MFLKKTKKLNSETIPNKFQILKKSKKCSRKLIKPLYNLKKIMIILLSSISSKVEILMNNEQLNLNLKFDNIDIGKFDFRVSIYLFIFLSKI